MPIGPPEMTDLVDALRNPRSTEKVIATGARVYPRLAEYYLRSNVWWSARGKHIPRALKNKDPDMFRHDSFSFQKLT